MEYLALDPRDVPSADGCFLSASLSRASAAMSCTPRKHARWLMCPDVPFASNVTIDDTLHLSA